MWPDEREMTRELDPWWPPEPWGDEELVVTRAYRHEGRTSEIDWQDAEGYSGRFTDLAQTRLEQNAPPNVVAMLHVGEPADDKGVIRANPIYLDAEAAIELGLALLESAGQWQAQQDQDAGPVNRMTRDQRWRAHVIACGLQDMTFWVHKDPRWPSHYYAVEIETGCGAWGDSDEEALRNYFNGKHDAPHEPVLASDAKGSSE